MSEQTQNRLDEIWADDLLGRREDAEFIQSFLLRRIEERGEGGKLRSYVLNIDAAWGAGKTFFLSKLRDQLIAQGHPVAFVNAWEDDHTDEPLTAVMAAIEKSVEAFLAKENSGLKLAFDAAKRNLGGILISGVKGAATSVGRKLLGDGFDEISAQLSDGGGEHSELLVGAAQGASEGVQSAVAAKIDTLFDRAGAVALSNFQQSARSISNFKVSIAQVVASFEEQGRTAPLFVLVDELDRCRPDYAIALLERIKHIFSIENVVFIVATDTSQLRHSIKAVYGTEFDSFRYLHRFFDRVYKFADPDRAAFIDALLVTQPLDEGKLATPTHSEIAETIQFIYACFGPSLSLRDVEQIHDALRTITTVWPYKVPIEIVALLPLLIGAKLGITPALNKTFLEGIKPHLTPIQPRSPFKFRVDPAYRGDVEEVPFVDLLTAYVAEATPPLELIGNRMNMGAKSTARGVVLDILMREFQSLHGRRHGTEGSKFSVIASYPQWIEMAGRVTGPSPQ